MRTYATSEDTSIVGPTGNRLDLRWATVGRFECRDAILRSEDCYRIVRLWLGLHEALGIYVRCGEVLHNLVRL
jgi:hypothetical protein